MTTIARTGPSLAQGTRPAVKAKPFGRPERRGAALTAAHPALWCLERGQPGHKAVLPRTSHSLSERKFYKHFSVHQTGVGPPMLQPVGRQLPTRRS